ncbi:MAG: hypothetical protein DSY77_00165, partial [Bacteroidetes bacterium]
MLSFFQGKNHQIYALGHQNPFSDTDLEKLLWLLDAEKTVPSSELKGIYVGPRKEMVSPWSTNAVEITQTMGLNGIFRIEM